MQGWEEFVCAGVIFLLSHILPARPYVRQRLTKWLGRYTYLGLYSVISLVLLAWLIAAAGRAPYVALWSWSPERAWLTNLLMVIALVLTVCGTAIANPFSLGGLSGRIYDPSRPGILFVTRHPLLWALVFWACAHLLVNGDLAHVVLFGATGVFAVLGVLVLERRARRRAKEEWRRLSAGTGLFPFAALLNGKGRWSSLPGWRLTCVPLVWIALVRLHQPVLGVSPLPPL